MFDELAQSSGQGTLTPCSIWLTIAHPTQQRTINVADVVGLVVFLINKANVFEHPKSLGSHMFSCVKTRNESGEKNSWVQGSRQNSMYMLLSSSMRDTTELPLHRFWRIERLEAAKLFPTPKLTVWKRSILWKKGFWPLSCINTRVNAASSFHGMSTPRSPERPACWTCGRSTAKSVKGFFLANPYSIFRGKKWNWILIAPTCPNHAQWN